MGYTTLTGSSREYLLIPIAIFSLLTSIVSLAGVVWIGSRQLDQRDVERIFQHTVANYTGLAVISGKLAVGGELSSTGIITGLGGMQVTGDVLVNGLSYLDLNAQVSDLQNNVTAHSGSFTNLTVNQAATLSAVKATSLSVSDTTLLGYLATDSITTSHLTVSQASNLSDITAKTLSVSYSISTANVSANAINTNQLSVAGAAITDSLSSKSVLITGNFITAARSFNPSLPQSNFSIVDYGVLTLPCLRGIFVEWEHVQMFPVNNGYQPPGWTAQGCSFAYFSGFYACYASGLEPSYHANYTLQNPAPRGLYWIEYDMLYSPSQTTNMETSIAGVPVRRHILGNNALGTARFRDVYYNPTTSAFTMTWNSTGTGKISVGDLVITQLG